MTRTSVRTGTTAQRAKARTTGPLLPVAICNSHRALGSGRSWPRLVPIQLRIGDPIPAPASRRRPDLDATTALLQERINALLDQGLQVRHEPEEEESAEHLRAERDTPAEDACITSN